MHQYRQRKDVLMALPEQIGGASVITMVLAWSYADS